MKAMILEFILIIKEDVIVKIVELLSELYWKLV